MKKFKLIAGPCVVEDWLMLSEVRSELKRISKDLDIDFIFKASYKKANRTSDKSFVGLDQDQALTLMSRERPIITDVHECKDVAEVVNFVDALQIPAFLCRQTELIKTAANTSKDINIKKGQFASAESMRFAVEKARSVGTGAEVWVTERGTSVGPYQLIVDMTGIPIMKEFADRVIIDATHSVQQPNRGEETGGRQEMIETLALSAVAAGADGLFIETHPNPEKALSDRGSQLHLKNAREVITNVVNLYRSLHKTK